MTNGEITKAYVQEIVGLEKTGGGGGGSGYPALHERPETTKGGTPYLKGPGVVMMARTRTNPESLAGFVAGFDPALGFDDYLKDPWTGVEDGAALVKIAGQLCYMSLAEKRTKNAETGKYLGHIKESGHGSVLEHVQFSFLLYGISRSMTHELVRHRSGCAYSQLSQRYADGKVVRFVERPEYQASQALHDQFVNRIDRCASEYASLAGLLVEMQAAGLSEALSGEKKTELRKKVNQCARSLLPNETEAPMIFSANARALRHVIEMRANPAAEVEIRKLGVRLFLCAAMAEPDIFSDYALVDLPDGTRGVETKWRKV